MFLDLRLRSLLISLLCIGFSFQALANYDYVSEYRFVKNKIANSTSDCYIHDWELETTYPQAPAWFKVEGELYRPKIKNYQSPVVILFPPVGGKNFLDEDTAKELCRNNIATFVPTTDFTGIDQDIPPPVEDHDHALLRVVAASKALISYSLSYNRLDGNKVGVMGASLGGIVGAFAMGALNEIQAGYFIVAGGDVPYILAHSTQERVVRLKNIRKQEVGFKSDDEYEKWLRKNLSLDPLSVAGKVPGQSVHMVISNNDNSVPTSTQYLLNKELGSPSYDQSSNDHLWTVVNSMSGSNRDNIVDFFNKEFKKPNDRMTTIVDF